MAFRQESPIQEARQAASVEKGPLPWKRAVVVAAFTPANCTTVVDPAGLLA